MCEKSNNLPDKPRVNWQSTICDSEGKDTGWRVQAWNGDGSVKEVEQATDMAMALDRICQKCKLEGREFSSSDFREAIKSYNAQRVEEMLRSTALQSSIDEICQSINLTKEHLTKTLGIPVEFITGPDMTTATGITEAAARDFMSFANYCRQSGVDLPTDLLKECWDMMVAPKLHPEAGKEDGDAQDGGRSN